MHIMRLGSRSRKNEIYKRHFFIFIAVWFKLSSYLLLPNLCWTLANFNMDHDTHPQRTFQVYAYLSNLDWQWITCSIFGFRSRAPNPKPCCFLWCFWYNLTLYDIHRHLEPAWWSSYLLPSNTNQTRSYTDYLHN